jgi:bleomycin hydrolase
MRIKQTNLIVILMIFACGITAMAQKGGGLNEAAVSELQSSLKMDGQTKAMINAVTTNDIRKMAQDRAAVVESNTFFSHKLKTEGITDQKSSGRCWLFAGLNLMRPVAMNSLNKRGFEFSQTYLFFWDKLEKANLFLEAIIQTRTRPIDDREVEWLLKNPFPDGGQWNMVVALVEKYGVVPAEIMPETESSSSTGTMNNIVSALLRKDASILRKSNGDEKAFQGIKMNMLKDVYKVLCFHLGVPPASFTYRYENKDGKVTEPQTYTPQEFYKKHVNLNLNDYYCLYSAPAHAFNKLYEIQFDRDMFDKPNMTFANIKIDDLKMLALQSLLDNEPVWFGCDVGRESDSKIGVMKHGLYDYKSIYGIDLEMSKEDRVLYQESVPSHAMLFTGVDVVKGKPEKWLVENSWGTKAGNNGLFTMYDSWFDEHMFTIIVNKKYIPKSVLDLFKTKAEVLPPWDPMFSMLR